MELAFHNQKRICYLGLISEASFLLPPHPFSVLQSFAMIVEYWNTDENAQV